jgi:tRNA/rRNA methyltransferase
MTSVSPAIILIEPQMGENIGAAARAMLNCGLTDLRIVNPRDGWPNERADAMSSGALAIMPPVQVFTSTEAAVADIHYVYATTARPRDMIKPVFTARGAAENIKAQAGQKTGYLFGPERAGLSNDDVALAHAIITIPMNPDFSSLNLGQGVLLCAYEWFQAMDDTPGMINNADDAPAPHAELNEMFDRLETELAAGGFFRTQELRPNVMRNLKNMLLRGQMTSQEVRTFHGIITTLLGKKKAAE